MNFINQNYMEHNMFQNSNSFKCSSYIDACKQYEFDQSMTQNPHATAKKQKSNRIVTNVKKMRQAISKKLKKLININHQNETTMTTRTPANSKLNQTATIRRSAFKSRTSLILSKSASSKRTKSDDSQNIVQLVNYKYNGSSNYDLTMIPNTPRVVPKRLRYNRYSDGVHSTSSSSSSLASTYSSYQANEESEQFRSAEITHLFTSCASKCQVKSGSMQTMYHHQQQLQQQQQDSFVSSQMQTSTPVQNKTRSISQRIQHNYELVDQASVYVESLFDNHQSDDLVVMQKKPSYVSTRALKTPPPVPSQVKIIESHQLVKQAIHQTLSNESKANWNLLVINKFHNDTNATFNTLPEWAVGNELNLAVVNQLYYNPNGNGIFNKQASSQL